VDQIVWDRLGGVHPQACDRGEVGEHRGRGEHGGDPGDSDERQPLLEQADDGRQQQQRSEVEEIPVADHVRAAETDVVRAGLEREQRDGERRDRGECA
jgi:hypothetical protein